VYVTLHRPSPDAARDTAVLICPPFGWDEVCSYRPLRAWAGELAESGFPALRLSFPSTGDSGGEARDPDRVGAWIEAVEAGSAWLLAETGAARVAVIGIGLGGLMAVIAAGRGAPIDALALWSVQARGRSLVRQLRAFSKLEVAQFFEGLEVPPPLPEGELEAGGFLLSAETGQALEAIDLATVDLTSLRARRALLLDRDGIAVDAALRGHLEAAGLEVSEAPGPGYGAMTSHPQTARSPAAVIGTVRDWLLGDSSPAPGAPVIGAAGGAVSTAMIHLRDGGSVRETPVSIPQAAGTLSGVLVEPLQDPLHGLRLILLNAGAVRRTGPSRMWVECARRWAASGLSTLRLDIEGIGDSDGPTTPYVKDDSLYVAGMVPEVLSAVDYLQTRTGGERFMLGGLCAGAYWSFHAALRDPRVTAIMMLNPRALIWDTGLGPARDLRALMTQPLSVSKIRRLATGPRLHAFLRWMLAAPRRAVRRVLFGDAPAAAVEHELDGALARLRESGKPSLLLFSDHEPLDAELTRSGRVDGMARWPNLTLERIAVRDHTLRPNWAQRRAHEILDRAIEAELTREAAASAWRPTLRA
jgi:dienelactone hydrolase